MSHIAWWFLLAAGLIFAGCGENETSRDDLPPSAPIWVERSNDRVLPQVGIRAEPSQTNFQHWVRIEWEANPEPDVVGYRLYRLSEAHDYRRHYIIADLTVGIHLDYGLARYSWIDRGDTTGGGSPNNMLAPDPETGESRGYFWEVRAYDEAGNVSPFSELEYYRLISHPYPVSISRLDSNRYTLSWQIVWTNSQDMPSVYVIRVYPSYDGPSHAVHFEERFLYDQEESVTLDFSTPLAPMYADCTYVCQLNAISNRRNSAHADSLSGSAAFTTFVYQN